MRGPQRRTRAPAGAGAQLDVGVGASLYFGPFGETAYTLLDRSGSGGSVIQALEHYERTVAHYRILERVGSGALGTVYRAQDTRTGREVALKVFWAYFSREPELVEGFLQEVRAVAEMDHPHILRVHDFGQDQRRVYVASDYIAERSLKDQHNTPVPVALAVEVARQVAEALDYAHQRGVLHRNIKPSNVLMDAKGHCYLGDFGVATLGEGSHPAMRVAMSSPMPEFMSPEQAEGGGLDARSDVYSLSVLVYNLITDDVPFPAYTPLSALAKQTTYAPPAARSFNPDVPEAVDLVLARGLAVRREERYATAGELASDLQRACGADAAQTEELRHHLDAARAAAAEREQVKPMEPARVSYGPAATVVAKEAVPRGGWLICPVCGHSNPAGTNYCVNCWARLRHVAAVSDDEEMEHARRLRRRRMIGRLTRVGVMAALAALAVGFGLREYLEVTREVLVPEASTRVSSASPAGEWAMRGLDPAQTSYEDRVEAVRGTTVKWTFETDEPINSSPAIVGGRVYLGTGDWRVVALDAETGELLWQYHTTGPVDSSPAVAGGLVFVGLFDGRVLAINADTGELEWSYLTGSPIFGSPLVHEGVLYIASGDASLYAFDAKTGELLWSFETDSWVSTSPALSEGLLTVSTRGGRVYFINQKTGQLRYYFQTMGRRGTTPAIDSSPAMVGTVAYVGGDDRKIHALRGDDYWRFGEGTLRMPWAQLYRLGLAPVPPRLTGFLWAVDTRSRVVASPAVGGGVVYAGAASGRFYALDAETGKRLWVYNTKSRIHSSPIVVGGVVYFGADNGKLYALDAETGEEVFTFQTGGKISDSAAVAGGVLYVASQDGKLYALH